MKINIETDLKELGAELLQMNEPRAITLVDKATGLGRDKSRYLLEVLKGWIPYNPYFRKPIHKDLESYNPKTHKLVALPPPPPVEYNVDEEEEDYPY